MNQAINLNIRDESLSLATTWPTIRPQPKTAAPKGRESNLEIQTNNGRHNQAMDNLVVYTWILYIMEI